MTLDELEEENERALAARPVARPDFRYRPVSAHDPELHRLKSEYSYFGPIEVEVDGVRPFVMLSSNDDVVAQVYFWFGANAYEPLSLRVWRRLAREAGTLVDVGAYTGLFTLVAAFANPGAVVHAVEPSPDAFGRLVANLSMNRLGQRVHLHEVAVADQQGTAKLHGYQGTLNLSTGSSLTPKQGKSVEWSRTVRTTRLETLLEEASGALAMKIDVEEEELGVVRGLGELRGARPRLLVEMADASTLRACLAALPGYTWAVLDDEDHTYRIEDDSLLVLRQAVRAGRVHDQPPVHPPNVLLWPGDVESLDSWLGPLAGEHAAGPGDDRQA